MVPHTVPPAISSYRPSQQQQSSAVGTHHHSQYQQQHGGGGEVVANIHQQLQHQNPRHGNSDVSNNPFVRRSHLEPRTRRSRVPPNILSSGRYRPSAGMLGRKERIRDCDGVGVSSADKEILPMQPITTRYMTPATTSGVSATR